MNYREVWANGDIEAGTLVDAIESLTAELADLKANRDALMLVHRVGRSLDQQRIETAADSCEVLRARLARYEDGEGNSIAWKASGADWCSSIHSNPNAKAWADFFVAVFPGQADKHELMIGWFANAMMAMHDHLKAQPISVVDERAAFEALRDCKGFEFFDNCYWLRAIPECPDEKALINADWELWRAATAWQRAALSAPESTHSEQVRQMVPDAFIEAARQADDVLTAIIRNNEPIATLERTYGKDWHEAVGKIRTSLILQIAAAASAGSQEQGE